jgi:hypothetical protein
MTAHALSTCGLCAVIDRAYKESKILTLQGSPFFENTFRKL